MFVLILKLLRNRTLNNYLYTGPIGSGPVGDAHQGWLERRRRALFRSKLWPHCCHVSCHCHHLVSLISRSLWRFWFQYHLRVLGVFEFPRYLVFYTLTHWYYDKLYPILQARRSTAEVDIPNRHAVFLDIFWVIYSFIHVLGSGAAYPLLPLPSFYFSDSWAHEICSSGESLGSMCEQDVRNHEDSQLHKHSSNLSALPLYFLNWYNYYLGRGCIILKDIYGPKCGTRELCFFFLNLRRGAEVLSWPRDEWGRWTMHSPFLRLRAAPALPGWIPIEIWSTDRIRRLKEWVYSKRSRNFKASSSAPSPRIHELHTANSYLIPKHYYILKGTKLIGTYSWIRNTPDSHFLPHSIFSNCNRALIHFVIAVYRFTPLPLEKL